MTRWGWVVGVFAAFSCSEDAKHDPNAVFEYGADTTTCGGGPCRLGDAALSGGDVTIVAFAPVRDGKVDIVAEKPAVATVTSFTRGLVCAVGTSAPPIDGKCGQGATAYDRFEARVHATGAGTTPLNLFAEAGGVYATSELHVREAAFLLVGLAGRRKVKGTENTYEAVVGDTITVDVSAEDKDHLPLWFRDGGVDYVWDDETLAVAEGEPPYGKKTPYKAKALKAGKATLTVSAKAATSTFIFEIAP